MTIRTIARMTVAVWLFVLFCSVWVASSQERQPERTVPAPTAGYVPKPLRPTGWAPPMRPFTRLADVKAQHKGEKEWSEWVVKDDICGPSTSSRRRAARFPRGFTPIPASGG